MNREHMVNMRKDGLPYEEMGYSGPPPNRKLPPVPGTNSNYNTIDRIKKAGGSMPGQDEDISPYATFHLLGMREEAKNGMMPNGMTPNGMMTMPATPGQGPSMTQPSTPAHQRQQGMSQTMNPNARRSMPGAPAPGMQLYDAPNCDYEPPKNFQQNFGNPYDCPEGFYNGSMMSSQGYSQVSDYQAHPGMQPGMQGPGVPGQQMMLPGQILAQQAMMQQMQQQQMERAQRAQPHEEYSTDTVIYKGGPPAQQPPAAAGKLRGPLPASGEDEFPPPPPERSADTSLNDSNG